MTLRNSLYLLCFTALVIGCKSKQTLETAPPSKVEKSMTKVEDKKQKTNRFTEEGLTEDVVSYESVPEEEVEEFQKFIRDSGEFFTSNRLAEQYHIEPIIQGHPTYQSSSKRTEDGQSIGTVVQSINQDPLMGIRVDVYSKSSASGWVITEIRRSYKCKTGNNAGKWQKNKCR